MKPVALALTDDLLLVVCALTRPNAGLAACSQRIQLALTTSTTKSDDRPRGAAFKARSLLSRAWHNRILLSGHDGDAHSPSSGAGELDWYTRQLNRQPKGPPVVHLTGSHLLYVLRTRLPRDPTANVGEYANGLAPCGPVPEDQLLSHDYVKEYLFSPRGPLLRSGGASAAVNMVIEFSAAMDSAALFSKSASSTAPARWWRPCQDLFCVVIFLLRAGHLDLLDYALRQTLAHAPNLLLVETHPIKHWSLLCLDNRQSTRSYFTLLFHHINRSNAPAPSITFPFFLATLALLEYSLQAVDIITSLFGLVPADILAVINPRIVLPYAPFTSLLLQQLSLHSASHTLIPIVQWFTNNNSPLSTTPVARYAKSVDMFATLLVQVDLPQIQAEFEASGNAGRRRVQLGKVGQAIVDLIVKNKLSVHQAGPLLALDVEYGGLVTWKGWARLLVFGHSEGGMQWVEAAEAAVATVQGTSLVQVLSKALEIELHASSPRRSTIQALFDRGAAASLSIMAILFHNMDDWNILALTALFNFDEYMSTSSWFTPAHLCQALDMILALDPTRHIESNTMHIMVHLISKVFAICMRRPDQLFPQHPPAWLAAMSGAHLALLFACVWLSQPSCQPRQRMLFSHSAEDFIELISQVWCEQQRREPASPAWHTCVPQFVVDHVRERIQYETRADVYYRADEGDQAVCQAQMAHLLDVDRKWLVQMLRFEGVDQAFTMGRWQ